MNKKDRKALKARKFLRKYCASRCCSDCKFYREPECGLMRVAGPYDWGKKGER